MTASARALSGQVVATEVGRRPLDGEQLADDGRFVGRQSLGQRGERRGQTGIVASGRPARGPSRGPGRSGCPGCRCPRACGSATVLVEEGARGPVEGVGQHLGPAVAGALGEVLEADGQGQELAQAVPPEVVLGQELLDVLGGRSAGPGLEQAAAVDQRDDRQHLGAGAQLQDGEQVGEIVAEHVAGHRDRVLPPPDALEGEGRRLLGRQDLDPEPLGVVLGEVGTRPWRSGWRRGPDARPARRPPGRRWPGPGSRRASPSPGWGRPWPGTSGRCRRRRPAPRRPPRRPRRSPGPSRRPGSRRSCRGCRTPRRPGPSGPTLGTEPMVAGSKAPCARQSSMTTW